MVHFLSIVGLTYSYPAHNVIHWGSFSRELFFILSVGLIKINGCCTVHDNKKFVFNFIYSIF